MNHKGDDDGPSFWKKETRKSNDYFWDFAYFFVLKIWKEIIFSQCLCHLIDTRLQMEVVHQPLEVSIFVKTSFSTFYGKIVKAN